MNQLILCAFSTLNNSYRDKKSILPIIIYFAHVQIKRFEKKSVG